MSRIAKKRPERLPIICESRKACSARGRCLLPSFYSFTIGAALSNRGTNLSNSYFSLGPPAGSANSFPWEPPGPKLDNRLIPGRFNRLLRVFLSDWVQVHPELSPGLDRFVLCPDSLPTRLHFQASVQVVPSHHPQDCVGRQSNGEGTAPVLLKPHQALITSPSLQPREVCRLNQLTRLWCSSQPSEAPDF